MGKVQFTQVSGAVVALTFSLIKSRAVNSRTFFLPASDPQIRVCELYMLHKMGICLECKQEAVASCSSAAQAALPVPLFTVGH